MSVQSDLKILNTVLDTARRLGIERKRKRKHGGGSAPSSTWSPTSETGCFAWYAARLLTGLSDGDPVASWTDLSGQVNHAVQSVLAKKPTYKTNRINSLPTILFDGTDDFLQTAVFGSALAQPITVFAVVKYTTGTATDLFDGQSAANRLVGQINTTTADGVGLFAGTLIKSRNATASTFQIWEIDFNGASSVAYIQNAIGTIVNPGANALGGITLGARFDGTSPWKGDIAEMIFFTGLGSAFRTNAYTYLSGIYAL